MLALPVSTLLFVCAFPASVLGRQKGDKTIAKVQNNLMKVDLAVNSFYAYLVSVSSF